MKLIVGFWDSGTTLLARLLEQHPEIDLLYSKDNIRRELSPKNNFINHALQTTGQFEKIEQLDRLNVLRNGAEYHTVNCDCNLQEFEAIIKNNITSHSLIKSNRLIFCKPIIDKCFPKIKKIIVLRNAKDYVASKPAGDRIIKSQFYVMLMQYILNVWYNDKNTLFIRYESLCRHPQKVLNSINQFFELPNFIFNTSFVSERNSRWHSLPNEIQKQCIEIIKNTDNKINKLVKI